MNNKINTNTDSNSNFPISKNFHQNSRSDSTSSSLNEENNKPINKNNFILNNNIKNTMKENNIDLKNLNEDIFPKERFEGNLINSNEKKKKYSFNQINNVANSLENFFLKNRELILKEDIPEMILAKYNYDINFFKQSLNDIDYEVKWLFEFLNMDKAIKENDNAQQEIINIIKNLLTQHKLKRRDIPYIIKEYEGLFSKYFTQSQIFDLLSVYDSEFLRLQKKRMRIINIFNYIIKDEDSNLSNTISQYCKIEYILEAKNEYELDLIETQLAILTYTNQSVEIDENYKKLINYEILSNSNIDFSLLNKIRDNKLNDILKKFCLSPEQVVHNLKVLKGELKAEIIEPPFANCSLGDLCNQKISEMSGKCTSPKEILKLSLEYYILLLSSHPYIFKFIYEKLYKISTLSTTPTEKGKEILNCLHPSYHCKRIDKMPISSFFEEKNENIMNIYTNELGDLYLDIEKCENNGLIKSIINTGINSLEYSFEIEQLISLLAKAANGTKEEKILEKINNPLIKKNIGARTVAIRNMILLKNSIQGFFLNYIKKQLSNYSEKYIIKKISEEFFNLISRNYLDNVKFKEDSFIVSIIYNSQKKYFKVLCLDYNFRCYKTIMKLEYLWRNEKINEASIDITLKISREVTEFQDLIRKINPRAIIIDVSNLECYKMINYIRNKFRECNLIYSDYISKIYKLKIIEITEQQENKQAIDQVKFVINPINQIMDLWNYIYEDNLLLNLIFHPQQGNIKDIAFFNYSLEMQIIRVLNSKGIYLNNLTKYSYNLFNFISGLGPCSSSFIIKNMNNPSVIKNTLKQNNSEIYESMSPFLLENNQTYGNVYDLKSSEKKSGLVKSEVFYSMIKDSIYFKKNCLCNAIVLNVDMKNQEVNCILLRDTNSIRAILKFCNIDPKIQDYPNFFYSQRIILCKIIDIKLRHHSYEILLSNKIDDLISVKDFLTEKQKNSKLFQKFTVDEEEDFKIKEIQRLKDIQQYDQEKQNKYLKYSLIDMENEQFLVNSNYNNIKKFLERYKGSDYKIRPSFLGENHLILTFLVIENIFLNFDIEIIKIELDNCNENNQKSYLINYKIENIYYKSLNELVDLFAIKMAKKIKEFKNNEFFRSPSEINKLFYQIFSAKSNNINENLINENKIELEYKNRTNDISIGFMRESPEYGILFTKSNDEYNYTIDFIKILFNGFLFHGKIFNSLYDLINFYRDVHNTNHYQNFLKRQYICNIHSQIEEIDEQYTEFEGTDPNIEKYQNYYVQTNEMKELKENLLISNPRNNSADKSFIGKKRMQELNMNSAWDNINANVEGNNMEIENENSVNNNNNWSGEKNRNINNKKKKKIEVNKMPFDSKSQNPVDNVWGKSNNNFNSEVNNVWGKSNNNIKSEPNDVWGKSSNNFKSESNPFNDDNNNENNPWVSTSNNNDWNNAKNNINNNLNDTAWADSNVNSSWNDSWTNSKIKTENNLNNDTDWANSNNNYKNEGNNKNNNRKEKNNNKKNNFNKNNNNKNNFNRQKNNNNKNNRQSSNFSWNPSNNNNANNNSSWNSFNDNNNANVNSVWNSSNDNNNNNNNINSAWNNNNGNNNSGWDISKDNNSSWNDNNAKDNSAWNNSNDNNDSAWGSPNNNNNTNNNNGWENSGYNNKSNNNSGWNNSKNNNDEWISSNNNNNSGNSGWGSPNKVNKKNNKSGWDSPDKTNKNNSGWGSPNQYNKNNDNLGWDSQDNLNIKNTNSAWDTQKNNNKENGDSSNNNTNNVASSFNWNNPNNDNNSWGESKNNNNNWNNKNNNDSWGNSNNKINNDDSWGNSNNQINNDDSWANSNNTNDGWANSKNNKNSFNNQNKNKNFNQNNDFRNNKGFKNNNKNEQRKNNFNKNNNKKFGNNNKSWNKINNTQSNFKGWASNKKDDNIENQFNSNNNSDNNWSKSKNDCNIEWGEPPKKNDKKRKKSPKHKWSDMLKGNEEEYDIKQEKDDDGDVINFNNEDMFGGYTLDNKNNQQ